MMERITKWGLLIVSETPSPATLAALLARRPAHLHAKLNWCPNSCRDENGAFLPMIQIDLSPVHASKRCPICNRGFYYLRTNTPEGRAMRTKLWHLKNKPESVKEKEPVLALTPAQRMKRYREKMKRELNAIADETGTVTETNI